MLIDGIEVEYRQIDGTIRGERVRFVDFDTPENNDWLAVNQFTVVETSERRPDIVLFINGLPLAVIELKNPTDEKATVLTAFRQIQTYKQEIPYAVYLQRSDRHFRWIRSAYRIFNR